MPVGLNSALERPAAPAKSRSRSETPTTRRPVRAIAAHSRTRSPPLQLGGPCPKAGEPGLARYLGRRLQQARLAEPGGRFDDDAPSTAQPGFGERLATRIEFVVSLEQCRRPLDHHVATPRENLEHSTRARGTDPRPFTARCRIRPSSDAQRTAVESILEAPFLAIPTGDDTTPSDARFRPSSLLDFGPERPSHAHGALWGADLSPTAGRGLLAHRPRSVRLTAAVALVPFANNRSVREAFAAAASAA